MNFVESSGFGINNINTLINFFDEESIYHRKEIAEDD